jgi:hypothetical protein
MTFALTSAVGGTAVPFCVGFAFRKGDIPAGQGVVGGVSQLQVSPKNYWPDGSMKFAIVAGRAPLSAGQASEIRLSTGTPAAAGTELTLANLKATNITATVSCGGFGSASWSAATDWDATFKQWVSGPEMSSWIYRKRVGTDAHLVAWLEVRLWADGSVEVLPWIENGYFTVAGPTNKSATYTFTLSGSQRFSQAFDLPHHCRTPLVSDVSHWLGTSPDVSVQHGASYLMSTAIVPSYTASVSASANILQSLPKSFSPLQQGNFDNPMGAGGYHDAIGLLPLWDVLYLTSPGGASYKGMIFNAYSLGRYAIHYRDEATNRPAAVCDASRPYLNISQTNSGINDVGASQMGTYTPTPTGTTPPIWAPSHHPSPGFLAYLVTGRYYFMEEVQFAASANYWSASSVSHARDGAKGIVASTVEQVRTVAWKWRTAVQAWCASPEDDTAQSAGLLRWLQENISYMHGRYIAQPNNPLGFIEGYGDQSGAGDNQYWAQTWMDDFVSAATGYVKAMGPTLDDATQAKLDAYYAWKARAVVGRFGGAGSSEFLYRDAAPYEIAMAPSDSPDFATGKGPWYANWGAVYSATYGGINSSVSSTTPYAPNCPRVEGGDLVGGYFGDFATAGGYWSNLQPALAYAVQHGIAGATTAWSRLTGAPNWSTQQNTQNQNPTWSVRPLSATSTQVITAPTPIAGVPAWRQGQAVNEWREIPNSAMALTPPSVNLGPNAADKLNAWNGLAIDTRTSTCWSLGNGGHGNYFGNEVMRLDLNTDNPRWIEVLASSPMSAFADSVPRYLDGRPTSVHSYFCHQFIERHNRAVRVGCTATAGGNATAYWDVDSFRVDTAPGTNGWDPQYTYDRINSSTGNAFTNSWAVCKNPSTEEIYVFVGPYPARKMTPGTSVGGTWATVGGTPPAGFTGYNAATAFDTRRNRIFVAKGGIGYPSVGNTHYFTFDAQTGAYTEQAMSGPALAALNTAAACPGMVYVEALDSYLVRLRKAGGTVYVINAGTFAVTELVGNGGSNLPAAPDIDATQYENIYNRWLLVPALSGIIYLPHYATNAWFLRLY